MNEPKSASASGVSTTAGRYITTPTRAITIKQPWASCVAAAASNSPYGKTVENRSKPDPWRSGIGERIAIHAGKGWDNAATKHPMFWKLADGSKPGGVGPAVAWMLPNSHHSGEVIATGVLADVHRCDGSCSPWADPDQWHLVWEDVVILDPYPAKGALGLWRLPERGAA